MSGFKLIPFRSRANGFEALMAPYIEPLYRLAYRFAGSRHDAEDLVQELLVRLYPKYAELNKVRELRPWLARSLRNLHIDRIRSQQRSALGNSDPDSDTLLETVPDPHSNPESSAIQDDRAAQIAQALDQLSEAHRTLIIMHDMEDYTLPELAEVFELPLGTMKSRLHRARQNLRELLQREPSEHSRRVKE
jgi:RNA polymerase sigma factor (sigma-70 family)